MNKALLIGRLTKDPESKTTISGKTIVSASLATNKRYIDSTGQKQEVVTYHNLVLWNRLAETFITYMKKGSKVLVGGEISNRSYEKKDGTKGYISEIIVNEIEFLGENKSEKNNTQKEVLTPTVNSDEEEAIEIENIPF